MNFYSNISIWWLLPLVILSYVIAYFYYKNQKQLKDISIFQNGILLFLRGTSLLIIGILLFEIVVEQKEYKTEKPIFISLIDNSSSMLNYSDSNTVKSKTSDAIKQVKERFKDRFDFKDYVVGSELSKNNVNFNEQESNLDAGFDFIYNQFYNRNIGAICFVSDGNFNVGKNPIYSARNINVTPIFTVGVGDTVVKKDHLIKTVSSNKIAFLNNNFPIEVSIEAKKMNNEKTFVSLLQGDKLIERKEVRYSNDNIAFENVQFNVDASKVGFIQYRVELEERPGEVSYQNNSQTIYIEVIDSRSKVLILAEAPHPDITAVKNVLEQDENMEVETSLVSDLKTNIKDYSLVIWHSPSNNASIISQLSKHNVPTWYLFTSAVKSSLFKELGLSINLSSRRGVDEVQAEINEGFQLFEVSEGLTQALPKWPPLKVPFGKIKQNGGSTFISQRIGAVRKDDPIFWFSSELTRKHAVLVGEGLWRWRLSDYSKTNEINHFSELIQNTVQFLTVKKNLDPLRVKLPKRFNVNDDIVIGAEFYNASMKPITTPNIQLLLSDDKGNDIPYEFAKNTTDYTLTLGRLKEGIYTWKVETSFNNQKYSKAGVFVVESISKEKLLTNANHSLLNTIATESNGKFYKLSQLDNFLIDLENRKDVVNISYEESSFRDLIDWKTICFMLFILLGIEWGLRRYWGSY